MESTSEQQFDALRRGTLPIVEEVRPGLYAIALDMPGMQPPYAFSYALFADEPSRAVHLIDAGLDTDANWERLRQALESLCREITDIVSVTVTHLHPDHTGLAWRIREASGATVRMHERDAGAIRDAAVLNADVNPADMLARWGVPESARAELLVIAGTRADLGGSGPVDATVADGELVNLGRFVAQVIHTPGHTGGHICLAIAGTERSPAVVFTGDHVLPLINPGIALGGERAADPLGEYYASLEKLAPFVGAEVLPGHGFRFAALEERIAEIRAHHERRTSEVAAVLAESPELQIWDIASKITWTGGWENLAGVSLLSALAQIEMHVDRVRAIHTPQH